MSADYCTVCSGPHDENLPHSRVAPEDDSQQRRAEVLAVMAVGLLGKTISMTGGPAFHVTNVAKAIGAAESILRFTEAAVAGDALQASGLARA